MYERVVWRGGQGMTAYVHSVDIWARTYNAIIVQCSENLFNLFFL